MLVPATVAKNHPIRLKATTWRAVGSGRMVMFSGTTRLLDMCHPAWSLMRTACALSATLRDISIRCWFMAWVSHHGMTRAAALRCLGQMAPKI